MVNTITGRVINVSVRSGNTTGRSLTSKSITLKNDTSLTSSTNRLDNLADVSEPGNPTDGSTLVYNSNTDIYEVRELDLDGGDF